MSTVASIVTSPNTGAIGVIRVVGPGAVRAVSAAFKPNRGRRLQMADLGQPRFGRMGRGSGDEVVVLVLDASAQTVEIHGHGGHAALRSILEELHGHGVELESNDHGGEMERLLAHAETLRVASILADQTDGAFERAQVELRQLALRAPCEAVARARRILELAPLGRRLRNGWRVVLVGRPNVGKSRLLNAIAGFERSIVSPIAGTTRDVVTARLAIDGWPVELCDTAGLRESATGLEAAGIALGTGLRDRCDLELIVLDRSCELTAEDEQVVTSAPAGTVIANKSDLPAAWDEHERSALPVSAVSGEGIRDLLTAIAARLVPASPAVGAVVPVLAEQVAWLDGFVAEYWATSDLGSTNESSEPAECV